MAMRCASWVQTFRLRWFGWWKIPLLGSLRPRVVELDDHRCVVRVGLRRWTRNHLGSLYFGTLTMGADCAGGLLAAEFIRRGGVPVSFLFKSFHADFLTRPLGRRERIRTFCSQKGRATPRRPFPHGRSGWP
jgi:hypothetical protein